MKELINIVKMAKIIDASTFQPKYRCIIDIDIECIMDTKFDQVIYKDGYLEKKFYNDFLSKLSEKVKEEKNEPNCIYFYPDQLEKKIGESDPTEYETISFPQRWIYMNQMLFPTISVSGKHLEAKTFKTNIMFSGRPDVLDNQSKLKSLVEEVQIFLESQNCEFFYYLLFQRVVNPKTLDSDYTVLVRGV